MQKSGSKRATNHAPWITSGMLLVYYHCNLCVLRRLVLHNDGKSTRAGARRQRTLGGDTVQAQPERKYQAIRVDRS